MASGVLVHHGMKRPHVVTNLFPRITVEEVPAGTDPHAFLEAAMDNCPECQEARARGEQPLIVELPRGPFAPRPRWRTGQPPPRRRR